MAVGISSAYFESLYEQLRLHRMDGGGGAPTSAILLLRRDGVFLAQAPHESDLLPTRTSGRVRSLAFALDATMTTQPWCQGRPEVELFTRSIPDFP